MPKTTGAKGVLLAEHLKYVSTMATPTLQEMMLTEFLALRAYDRYLRGVRPRYAQNADRTFPAIARFFPAGGCLTHELA